MKKFLGVSLVLCCLAFTGLHSFALGDEQEVPLPIVYSKHYNITLFAIQKLHPFDSEKYGRVFGYLKKNGTLTASQIHEPEAASRETLLKVHTPKYLDSLKSSDTIARIAEMGALKFMPGWLLDQKILKPMRYGTGGTILACKLALQYGWSINLSGGYHHAKADHGEGFCFFADIPIAAQILWAENPDMRIMVVDLDAHQGNGYEAIFQDDPRVFIFDMYNEDIYPADRSAAKYINFAVPVQSGATDGEYLALLETQLPPAIISSNPNLIIFNAGTDIFKNDPLGALSISVEGIIARDEFVFKTARKLNVPVAMVLSGGYTKESSGIIAQSIINLLENVFKTNTMRMASNAASAELSFNALSQHIHGE